MNLAPSRAPRPGFTLVELLVVIAIIAILLALTAAGVFSIIGTQQQTTTENSLQVIYDVFQKQWDKVISDAKKEVGISPAVMALADNDINRARVIWIKVRLMEAFPMSYAEIQNPVVYNVNNGPLIPVGQRKNMPTYQRAVGNRTSNNAATEAGACLLLELSVSRGGVVLNTDQVSTADTDGDGLKELTDGYGTALGFYRFPYGNADLQASNPNPGQFNDPLDPTGLLVSANWTKANQTLYQQLIHPVSPNGLAPSYYLIPVIVSAGANKALGLDATMAVINPANDSNDNLWSYRLKQGGGS
jgi:prepilin-type N-terminal cleavage/methylation domain-containing protein